MVFLPFLAAAGAYAAGKKNEQLRERIVVGTTAAELLLALVLLAAGGRFQISGIFGGFGLHFLTDGFRRVYALVTAFMWFCTTVFSSEYFAHEKEGLNHYYAFVLMTLGATEGVMLSADLMTTFVFFEILSFTSFTWVIHEQNPGAIRAGYTYLFIAIIGGLVLLMGLILLNQTVGTLVYQELGAAVSASPRRGQILAAAICILFGFGCKAGMFPVHVWLPKAHPVAPSPASALLSGILTKVGIFGILMTALEAMQGDRIFGLLILILGLITMLTGAVLALFSVNLKRTLACSSMSQVGFILSGIGMELLHSSSGIHEGLLLALSGTVMHMLGHSLIKLTLFMAAGVVVMNLHTLTLDEIKGWGRDKYALKIAFAFGALGISGVPLFNGYISKTLLHEGIVEGIHTVSGLGFFLSVSEWIFLFSGGLTFAYMLKLFICIFVEEKNREQIASKTRKEYAGIIGFIAEKASILLKIVSKAADGHRKDTPDGKPYMNLISTTVLLGSSILMYLLGIPAVSKRVAAFMTGNQEILGFHAFSFNNLKGSLISLIIGLLVYLLFVRKVLYREESYVDLWPCWLDLENLIYRPVLTRYLPDFFGNLMAVFGENRILRPLAGYFMRVLGIVARVLESCMDWVIVMLRHTVMRERPVVTADRIREDSLILNIEEIKRASEPIKAGFSYALMMTCAGVLVILGVLVFYLMKY